MINDSPTGFVELARNYSQYLFTKVHPEIIILGTNVGFAITRDKSIDVAVGFAKRGYIRISQRFP